MWAGGSGDGKLSRAEPGSPGDAPAHCSALLPARVADLATGGEALPPPPPRSPAPPANPAAAQQPNYMREAQRGGAAPEIFLDFDIIACTGMVDFDNTCLAYHSEARCIGGSS